MDRDLTCQSHFDTERMARMTKTVTSGLIIQAPTVPFVIDDLCISNGA